MHGKEIDALKAAIQNLSLSVAKLQSQPCVTPLAPASPNINQISSEIIPTKPTISKSTLQHSVDSKFNLVIYGIKEHPKGTQRHIRSTQDLDTVTSILSSLHPSIAQYSVRVCTRLGKFSESRCRPILCTMSRSIDVSAVLTNRSLLSQKHRDIFIKPYLTSEARKAETILLKQRRELITSGISSKTIKLRDDSLSSSTEGNTVPSLIPRIKHTPYFLTMYLILLLQSLQTFLQAHVLPLLNKTSPGPLLPVY